MAQDDEDELTPYVERERDVARLQALYRQDWATAASSVMGWSWKKLAVHNPITKKTGFLDAWQQLFETEAETVDLSTMSGQGWLTPITIEEVTKSVSSMGQTATGRDRVSRKTMTGIPFTKMV